jgi:hypothetical protein
MHRRTRWKELRRKRPHLFSSKISLSVAPLKICYQAAQVYWLIHRAIHQYRQSGTNGRQLAGGVGIKRLRQVLRASAQFAVRVK